MGRYLRSWKLFVFVTLIGISSCLILWLLIYPAYIPLNEQFMDYDVRDDGSMAIAFTVALMENNQDVLKAVVDPERWPEVDNWLATHEAYDCKFVHGVADEAYINMILGGGGTPKDGNHAKWNYLINCPSYRLEIDEIILEFYGDERAIWQIVSWDVCERREDNRFYPANCTASDFRDAFTSQ